MGTDKNNNNSNSNGSNNGNNGSNQRHNSNRRNNNSSKNNNKNKNNSKHSNNNKGKAKAKELNEIVFDADRFNQADEFLKAKQDIAEYISTHFTEGDDIKKTIETGKRVTFTKPSKPSGNLDEIDELIMKKEVDLYVKRKTLPKTNLHEAYNLI